MDFWCSREIQLFQSNLNVYNFTWIFGEFYTNWFPGDTQGPILWNVCQYALHSLHLLSAFPSPHSRQSGHVLSHPIPAALHLQNYKTDKTYTAFNKISFGIRILSLLDIKMRRNVHQHLVNKADWSKWSHNAGSFHMIGPGWVAPSVRSDIMVSD